jgi:hypothetical protein
MIATPLVLSDLVLEELQVYRDNRRFSVERFQTDRFAAHQ